MQQYLIGETTVSEAQLRNKAIENNMSLEDLLEINPDIKLKEDPGFELMSVEKSSQWNLFEKKWGKSKQEVENWQGFKNSISNLIEQVGDLGEFYLKEYFEKIIPFIKKDLKKYSKNLTDKVVKIKFNEAINSVDKFCGTGNSNNVKDSSVVQTMRYLELLKELKKSGNKKQKVI